MVRRGSLSGLQSVIDDDIVRDCDLLIAVFRRSLGSTRGTVQEIQQFIDLGRIGRILVLAYNGGRDAEPELHNYLEATIKPILSINPYGSVDDIPQLLHDFFWKQVAVTLAAPSIRDLRIALSVETRHWVALQGGWDGGKAYAVLTRTGQALRVFADRRSGRPLAVLDDQVRRVMREIIAIAPTPDAFLALSPSGDAAEIMASVNALLSTLPDEDDLL